jgi:hypothetical protein
MAKSQIESIPDKEYMYGKFQEREDWKDKLHRKLSHKALDIKDADDLNVDNSVHKHGMDWKSLAVIAATVLGGGFLASNVFNNNPVQPPGAVSPTDSEYDVRFYDAEGNLIDIPHISKRK